MMIKIALSMGQVYIKERNETRDFIDNKLFFFLKECFNCEIYLINNFNKINKKNILNLRNYLTRNKINFIVLRGGEDIGNNKFRDFTEINLLKYSIQKNIPLLGLCRGMQLINLFFKGKLKKIEGHIKKKNKLYLKSEKKYRKVTCFHGNGIKKLGNGFFVMHKSYDNEVESIKHKNKKILGIMWHPERFKNFQKSDIKLIRDFAKSKK